MEGTYLLTMRGPAFRRHDSYLGFRTVRTGSVMLTERRKWTTHEADSTEAPIRGALPRKSEEAG